MLLTRTEYDRGVNTFSPEGRLFQVEYAIEAIKVVKHEWTARWQSFIPDLVSAARTSETICENCMAILKLLPEEVFFYFSRGELTQQKIEELKQSMNRVSYLLKLRY